MTSESTLSKSTNPKPRDFLSATRAATAVEFAFVAPIIFGLMFFTIWMGYVTIMGQMLDLATQRSARQIATGSVQTSQYTQGQFVNSVLCSQLNAMFNCNNLVVRVQNVPTTDASYPSEYYGFVKSGNTGIITPTLNNAALSYCPGNAGDTVYLQILYPLPILVPFLANLSGLTLYNGSPVMLLDSSVTFLNEPFMAPVSPC